MAPGSQNKQKEEEKAKERDKHGSVTVGLSRGSQKWLFLGTDKVRIIKTLNYESNI